MKPKELQQHKLDVIEEIQKYLNDIKEDKNPGFFFNIGDLLCRVGELESTLRWQFDLERNENAKPKKNRLCVCYYTDDDNYDE